MFHTQSRSNKLISFMVNHRFWVLLIVLFGTGCFFFYAPKIGTEVILQDMFPVHHPYLQLLGRFSQVFGSGGSGVVIAVKAKEGDIFNRKTLTKIKKITEDVTLWDEVYRSLTISIASNSLKAVKVLPKGEIVIQALMFPNVPETESEMALLKKHIFSNPSYAGTFVSNDGTAALILTEIKESIAYESGPPKKVSYEQVFNRLQKLIQKYSDNETSIHVVGFPMLMGWIYSYKTQMCWVFAISLVVMVLLLFIIFRSIVGIIAPIFMSAICIGLSLGFIGWTGINFSPLLYVLAFLVGARMLSNAVQITHRYIEEYYIDGDKLSAARRTVSAMLMPNAAAVATDVVGFLVLGLAEVVLMKQLAVLMSFWMCTIILMGAVVPIICSCLPMGGKRLKIRDDAGRRLLAGFTMAVANFTISRHGKFVVIVFVVAFVMIGGWQTTRLKIGDATPGSSILWPEQTYNRDQVLINEIFNASSENFVLYYEGTPESVYDPVVLTTFEKFSQHMAATLPDIYKSSSSIINIGAMLNQTQHDGDPLWYQLPRNEKQLTGLLGQVRNNVGMVTLSRFIDNELERAQITLFFADHTSDNLVRIEKAAYDFFTKNTRKTDRGEFKLAGGRIGMEIALNEEMKRSHAIMDGLVFIAIFIMCSIAFRSFVAGMMLTAPLILSNLIAFSYMAVANIGLSVNTLPCAAVGVGVGVDFAIYLYSRCVEEYPHHKGWKDIVTASVRTTGGGIVYTGITLILPILTWYFISELKFQAQMGFFLSMLLLINMVAAFTLHPLLILTIKPNFMKRNITTENEHQNQTSEELSQKKFSEHLIT